MAVPFARKIATFNNRVTNRILGPLVWYLTGFGKIEHIGRRTGRRHVSPMMAFRSSDRGCFAFALTYGPEAEWVRNVLVAGEFTFDSRWSGRVALTAPRLIRRPLRRPVPRFIGWILRLIRVDDFLEATVAGGAAGSR
ncbi:MAG: hypothetical protein QOF49_448 [Chloroflexota bacterium]|nr:hypothetical protein [Chloroflexota bacterium]